jgi:hypothetical protein
MKKKLFYLKNGETKEILKTITEIALILQHFENLFNRIRTVRIILKNLK